jgi:macrolide phosphotransferase
MAERTGTGTRSVAELAAEHGLDIEPASVRINEAGLDFQVALATEREGRQWVLRIPRRADAAKRSWDEARILKFVAGRLPVQVPDWQIHTDRLIAYPLLPGEPGLTLDHESGEPLWHFDREDPAYCASLGRLIAALHAIDPEEARAAGLVVTTPEKVRSDWRRDLERVDAEFEIAPALRKRWEAWLDNDGLWPDYTAFTHGELYPAHLLLDEDQEIVSVLDWTTAKVGDPALDFMFHYTMATPAAFELTLRTYGEAGGRVPRNLAEQCTEIMASAPLSYAVFALSSGEPDHRATAESLLRDDAQ